MAPADRDIRDFDHPALNYRAPRSVRILHATVALVLSVAVVVGVWSLIWVSVATLGKREVANWIEGLKTQGIEISYAEQIVSGWPSRIDFTYLEPRADIKAADANWKAERLRISMKVWQPWLFDVDASGSFRLQTRGGSGPGTMRGSAKKLSLKLNPGDRWPDVARLAVEGFTLSGTLSGEPLLASVDRLRLELETNPSAGSTKPAVQARLKAQNLILPWGKAAALSNRAGLAELDLKITGPVQPGSGLAGIEHWQAQGGKILIDNLVLHGQPLGLSGAGTVNLDENLQPGGQLTSKITGLLPTINRFRDAGLIRDSDAVLAKMTLAALSQKTGDGRSVLNLSVEVKQRTLYLGPIPVAEIPELDLTFLD